MENADVDDPVGVYLAAMREVPPLSGEQEALCVQHIRAKDKQADRSRKTLMEANLELVVAIAQRHQDDRIYILDLIIKGNEGLLEALKSFAESTEGNFSAYAAPYIERAIADAVCQSE
jgi:RNA polymerase primary sigma factor